MPKGIFTQGFVILLEKAVTLDAIAAVLGDFDIRKRIETFDEWEFSGPSLVVAYLPEINGAVSIDVVDRVWPDDMGGSDLESMVLGAWTMGHFGPFTFPENLRRASEQAWTWEPGATIAARHQAFIRIRSSYAFGLQDDAPIIPDDYDPIEELSFVTELTLALLELPGAICYFNPGGEVLLDREALQERLAEAEERKFLPLEAWCNVRLFNIDSEWVLMDTVGNGQLDIPDIEVCCSTKGFEVGEMPGFLRFLSLYVLQKGVIPDGDTIDGPGEVAWQATSFDNGICDPPRQVLRLVPQDGRPVPEVVLGESE